jgi:septum formation protein
MASSNPAQRPLILASTSRYRAQLLQQLQVEFTIANPQVDETALPGESADTLALRLAHAKAAAVADAHPEAVVIGADQVGACDGRLLTKPMSPHAAERELLALSGRAAHFYSAVAVHHADEANGAVVRTDLTFRQLTEQAVAYYVSVDNPIDCSGAFKIESLGISLFRSVNSNDPSALVGLPLIALVSMLTTCGIHPLQAP